MRTVLLVGPRTLSSILRPAPAGLDTSRCSQGEAAKGGPARPCRGQYPHAGVLYVVLLYYTQLLLVNLGQAQSNRWLHVPSKTLLIAVMSDGVNSFCLSAILVIPWWSLATPSV